MTDFIVIWDDQDDLTTEIRKPCRTCNGEGSWQAFGPDGYREVPCQTCTPRAPLADALAARGIDITHDELADMPIPYRLPFGDGGER